MKFFSRKTSPVVLARRCSVCGEPLAEHEQRDIASAEIGTEDDERLTALIAADGWVDARRYQAANAVRDIRVWRIIRCRDGRVGVVALVMPIEMWSDDYYGEPRFLSDIERERILAAMM